MFKNIVLIIATITLSYSSLITVTDKNGNVLHKEVLKHKKNEYLSQKATEYSLQAMYDELHRAENLARRAQAAKQRVSQIAKSTAKAKKQGKNYKLTNDDKKKLLDYAKFFKGGKYVWGGTTPKGFDCSGYVQYLYKKHGINLPRTAWSQSKRGIPVDKDHLKKGDLLFFLTDKKRGIPVTHVGIYLGNGEFIHAASKKKGIIISPFYHGYYSKKFVKAKRVFQDA
ncbi:NLP/P60 family protein [hydrothermal vent metagenome]|uniref:NLP/P60 family protein n=1 Tax=hydrothermal vent metagenome TaxID=652676 RepID=A0A1W1EDB5_9ZZZZ